MDINIINDYIDELESKESSLSTIRNLSALYNVKNHLLGISNYDNVTKELSDILPSYIEYTNLKRRYQLKEISIDSVLIQLNNVCVEIKEFIQTLYSGTDTKEERECINELVTKLKGTF